VLTADSAQAAGVKWAEVGVEAIETELGTNPSGSAATVKARLDGIEDGTRLGANSVGATQIANDSVDTAAIQSKAVTAAKIADDTITAAQIAANAVGASELADNAVDTNAIADSAVTSAKIADGTITATDVAADTFAAFGTVGNLLTANQASGTDTLGDTTGFACDPAKFTLSSSGDWAYRGVKSLKVLIAGASYPSLTVGTSTSYRWPVTSGDTYTVRARINTGTLTGTSLSTLRMYTNYYDSGGSAVGSASQTIQAGGLFSHTFTAAATVTQIRFAFDIDTGSANVGEYFYLDSLSLHRGASGTFAMPGVPVVGGSHIATNGAVHLSGTGVPESVITAAPGSTFLQTDSVTDVKGWIRWVKATGTGWTGWVAGAEADTGWRDVTTAFKALVAAHANAAWFTLTGTYFQVFIRRVGTRVSFNIRDSFVTSGSAGNTDISTSFMGAGFLPKPDTGTAYGPMFGRNTATVAAMFNVDPGSIRIVTTASNPNSGMDMAWLTGDAWPASLPGTAA
jgi:hypothetical protein